MIFRTRLLRMYEWRRGSGCRLGQSFALPVASFLHAGAEVPRLRAFFNDKRSAAFRARLIERLVRRSVIAIGGAAAAVKNAAAPASFGRAAADKFAFSAFRALDSKSDGPRVFAFRIIFATDEIAEAALAAKQL